MRTGCLLAAGWIHIVLRCTSGRDSLRRTLVRLALVHQAVFPNLFDFVNQWRRRWFRWAFVRQALIPNLFDGGFRRCCFTLVNPWRRHWFHRALVRLALVRRALVRQALVRPRPRPGVRV